VCSGVQRELFRGTVDDLQTTTLLVSTVTPPAESQRFLQQVLGRRKLRLAIQRLPLTEAILDAARAGMGVAVLSEWIAGPHLARGDLVARRLTRGPLHRPWRLASRKEVGSLAVPLKHALEATVPHTRF
jgi:LysR family transcriptional regulator, regulator for metE and metH